MDAKKIISEVEEKYSEWIEMSQDPNRVLAHFLANQIISLKSHIEYLERRVKYAERS